MKKHKERDEIESVIRMIWIIGAMGIATLIGVITLAIYII